MKIKLAKSAGFCFGVDRAVGHVEDLLERGERNLVTLGELIHNPAIIGRLGQAGVKSIAGPEDAPSGARVVIRAHGATPRVLEQLKIRGARVDDMTCPFVARIQRLAAEAAAHRRAFIIAGDAEHPEILGIRGHFFESDRVCAVSESLSGLETDEKNEQTENYFFVVKDAPALRNLTQTVNFTEKSPILTAQTTFDTAEWKKLCAEFEKMHYTNAQIFDTICSATAERQQEARRLADVCDAMIVIGGRNSANTARLYEICSRVCADTFLVQGADEICLAKLKNKSQIGITAGASTPVGIIEEVLITMEELNKDMEVQEEMSFEEALNESFKTVRRGEIITGTIMAIMPNEIQVDVGAKYTGILPMDEITGSPSEIAVQYKVGDEIEAQIIKTNDVEGTATLSRKRMDAQKAWQEIADALESGATLAGKISNAVNGGVVVTYHSNRIFIPASQITSDRQADLSQLVGQTVQFKIIEVDRRRRRVIGSVKRAYAEQRREAREKILAEIEVGKHYEGTVRSLTSYGAFVNIGGIDGMVHISELAWSKLKHPSEVVNVGDVVDVYVKDFDEETGRISLGYKDPAANPMDTFKAGYHVDDVVDVKIVKLMKYGAFAEIIPGIDGLIHISEIAPEHIEKVSDKLKVGDVVAAKIIEIDFDRNRISLSIKAALPEDVLAQAELLEIPVEIPGQAVEESASETVEEKAEMPAPAEETIDETAETAVSAEEIAAPVTVEPVVEAVEETMVEEPVKKTRKTKKAEAEETAPVEGAAVEAIEETVVEEPVKKPRKTKKAEAEETAPVEGAAVETVEETMVEELVKKPRKTKKAAEETPAEEPAE